MGNINRFTIIEDKNRYFWIYDNLKGNILEYSRFKNKIYAEEECKKLNKLGNVDEYLYYLDV